MPTINLLYEHEYKITDKIKVLIPTVDDILNAEDSYYGAVSILTAMPIDMMVQLEDAGIDFTDISAFDLFLMLFQGLQEMDTSLVFGDLDLKSFRLATNEKGKLVLIDPENDIKIDAGIHRIIATALRKIHHLEQNRRKPGNQEAKEFMLQRARIKAARNKNRSVESQLESLIVAMVNTEQFKYDLDSVRNLTIYQFNECVRQIIKKVNYDNRMYGVYAGTVNAKELSPDDLNWLTHK